VTSAVEQAAAMSEALREWLATEFGGTITDHSPPAMAAGGFDCAVFLLHFSGDRLPPEWTQPLVARVPPSAERFAPFERETRLQGWCADHGYPAPPPVTLLPPGVVGDLPVQVVARAPGEVMTSALTATPWRMRGLVAALARTQAALHRVPLPPWAEPDQPEWSLLERRLALVRMLAPTLASDGVPERLAAVDARAPLLRVGQPIICHGDFHPFNVLVHRRQLAVIDWTDCGIGDHHGDVARTALLFELPGIAAVQRSARAAMRPVGRALARSYLHAYHCLAPLEPSRLALWRPVHLLQLWVQALADEREVFGPSLAGTRYRRGLAAALLARLDAELDAELDAGFEAGLRPTKPPPVLEDGR
jgi:aminoglycoside phosphotransferase (APT) family kinase protein